MDDAHLINLINQYERVDENQFLSLIDQNQGIIQKICILYRDSWDDRQDLFQEIVFRLWKSGLTFDDKEKFRLCMYRISLSTAIAGLNKKKPDALYPSILPDKQETQQKPQDHSAQLHKGLKKLTDDSNAIITLYLEDLSYQETQQKPEAPSAQLLKALKELTDDDKAIITLYLEDLSYQEIATITGISETIAGVKLSRIKKKIQQFSSKSDWQTIEVVPKRYAELRSMMPEHSQPVLKRIRKVLIFETIAFTIFLFVYYALFDGNRKPLHIHVLLAITMLISILHNAVVYMLTKSPFKAASIKKSLEKLLFKLKAQAVLTIVSRVMVTGCLFIFLMSVITFNTNKYFISAFIILTLVIQVVLMSGIWMKRIRQLRNTIERLKRQKEFR